jgi:hypothetical protein
MHKLIKGMLVAALSASATAYAQSGPYSLGVTQTFGHTDNVRNAPDGTPSESDTYSTTVLAVGLDQPISRQRLFADASASYTRYRDADSLDNTGYNLQLGLDWATVNRLSGSLVAGASQRLSQLNPGAAALPSRRNLERSRTFDATARLGGDGRLALEATFGHRNVDFSAAEFTSREYEQNRVSGGLVYRAGGALTLSTGLSAQRTRYPRFVLLGPGSFDSERSKRRDVYVGANWTPTGASVIDTRLSYAKVESDTATGNDFSGVTGLLTWQWRPTGKLHFTTTLSRDTGQETGFIPVPDDASPPAPGEPVTNASDFSRITNALRLRARYELTAKVVVDADAGYSRRDLGDPVGGSADDSTRRFGLGAVWSATRTVSFGCNAGRESRSSSSVLSSEYTTNTFACFGRLALN